jgi:hypothetical protein
MLSTLSVVLHTGQAVTLGEYLFRVLVYGLAFTGISVTSYVGLRVYEIVNSEISKRERINEIES